MPGNNEVVILGRAEFDQILKSLQMLRDSGKKTQNEMGTTGKKVQDNLEKTGKKTETSLRQTSSVLRRIAGQLFSDFKALASLSSIQGALKLQSQFAGAVTETIALSDTIRRLGGSFGIARQQFGSFQSYLAKGLGEIGASSEEASQALQGLSGFGVKGAESAAALSKGAVTLAGMSGERGNVQSVATLLAKAIQSQGKDVNDRAAQEGMIGEVTAAVQATGKTSSELLSAMDQMFSTMDKSLRGKIGPEAMSQMAVLATTVGPQATKALQEYLSKSTIERSAMEAQGFGGVIGKDGQLDIKALNKFITEGQKRIGFDPRKALQTFGFSDEAAEGLIRVAEQSKAVEDNMRKLSNATRDNEMAFRKSMGMMDSFKGAINTVKGKLEGTFEGATQTITDMLQAQVGDTAGSTAVVAGGGILAALLAGGGLRGLGGALSKGLGGFAKKEAYETITGEDVQSVYVVNASEISSGIGGVMGGAGMMDKLKGGAGLLGKGSMVGGAAYGGYELGSALNEKIIDPMTQGTTEEGFEGNVVERLFFKLDKLFGGEASTNIMKANQQVKVVVETKSPNLKARQEKPRGATQ